MLQLGVCTGPASAGIIGSECMSFIVTGPAAQIARHLADCAAPLTVSSSTWHRLSHVTRTMYEWAPPRAIQLPAGTGCVEAQSLVPPPGLGYGAGSSGSGAAVEDTPAPAAARGSGSCGEKGGAERAACDGSCAGLWTIGRGFVQAGQEAAFHEWHDAALSTFDQARGALE